MRQGQTQVREASTYKQPSLVLSSFRLHRAEVTWNEVPWPPLTNRFGCFSLRSTLTVIESGTFKRRKHKALTDPAAQGPTPFTQKPLNKRNMPKLCKCQGLGSHSVPCPCWVCLQHPACASTEDPVGRVGEGHPGTCVASVPRKPGGKREANGAYVSDTC